MGSSGWNGRGYYHILCFIFGVLLILLVTKDEHEIGSSSSLFLNNKKTLQISGIANTTTDGQGEENRRTSFLVVYDETAASGDVEFLMDSEIHGRLLQAKTEDKLGYGALQTGAACDASMNGECTGSGGKYTGGRKCSIYDKCDR